MRGEMYQRILKIVSATVVMNMAFGGFLGLMLMNENANVEGLQLPTPVGGTITINSYTPIDGNLLDNNTLRMDYNITITNNGILELTDLTLKFRSDILHRLWLRIQNGGQLILDNSTITVETSPPPYGSMFENYEWVYWFNFSALGGTPTKEYKFKRLVPFNITVTGAGSLLKMSDGSSLEYEGELYITGASEAFINDSVITSPNAPESTHDWGVVVQIDGGSTVVFADSRIEKSPWYQGVWWHDEDTSPPDIKMYDSHSIMNSDVFFINTYFDLDYRNKYDPHMYKVNTDNHFPPFVNPNHNALVIGSSSTVRFYGLTIDMSETGDKIPTEGSTAIEVLDTSSEANVYRWLAVYPVDNASIPVENAIVNITTIWTGALATQVNLLNNLNDANNFWEVEYLNRVSDASLQMIGNIISGTTGTSGKVIVALVSDMLTDSGWPNADEVDGYNVEASMFSDVTNIIEDFENFPRLFPEDNFVTRIMPKFNFAAPHPELYPEFIVTPPSSILEGLNVNISVRVWNVNETVTGVNVINVKVQFWDGDPKLNTSTKIGEKTIPSILAGTNQTTWIVWNATPPGSHTIYVAVDRDYRNPFQDNLIPEVRENNNVIKTKIEVLERADLFVSSADITFSPSNEIVNGTGAIIKAVVHNVGGSTASNVDVYFYYGTISGPTDFIGSSVIKSISAGGTGSGSTSWTPPTSGPYYVWAVVDPNFTIIEKDENNNSAYNILTVKRKPDLNPSLETDPLSPQFEETLVTLNAHITNDGEWNVTQEVKVVFYLDDPSDPDNKIGEDTIPRVDGVSIPFNDTRTASITWLAEDPGTYTLWVVVDPDNVVIEGDETNNMDFIIFVVNPKPNLIIKSEDILLSDAYPMNGTDVNINITIRNIGLSDVIDTFYVRIYLDEVSSVSLLTEFTVSEGVVSGNYVYRDYDWSPATPPGMHDILVWVDFNNTVSETLENDNMNSTPITIMKVPSDLIVNDTIYGTLILKNYWDASDPYVRKGFTLVEEHGTLIIRNSIFKVIDQRYNDEFTIVVKDDGTLIIEDDSQLTSEEFHVNLYLFDNARLYVNDSLISNLIDIIATDNAEIYINDQSSIQGDVYANSATSNVYINAVNSSFSKNLNYLGGNTFVELWGVNIAGVPASDDRITVTDNAMVYINWFLTVNIIDINNVPIIGADVTWERSPPWIDSTTLPTNDDGEAYFWLRGMNITSDAVVMDIRSYMINASFLSPVTMLTYYPDSDVAVDMTRNKEKTLKFSSVWPELDPPLFIVPDPTFIGDLTTITAYVNNTGPGDAEDVEVEFDDNVTGETFFPKMLTNDIPAGGSWMIVLNWTPVKQGVHNITIGVDPNYLIIEGDEENNYNYYEIYVGPQKADLNITSGDIMFTLDQNNPYGPTENDTITIKAYISNDGDTDANNVVVEFYKTAISGGNFIGSYTVPKVKAHQTAVASIQWSGTTPPGLYTIIVWVDPPDDIAETREDNNIASNTITIKTYADIRPLPPDFSPVSPVTDQTVVTITASVDNLGETAAPNVVVEFFDGNPSLGVKIGEKKISLIGAGDSEQTSITWTATVDGKSEVHTIYIRVSGVTESVTDNNENTGSITVTLRADLTVESIGFSDVSPYELEDIIIYASLKNIGGTNSGTFSVGFYDGPPENGIQIGSYQTLSLNVDQTGNVQVDWTDPSGGSHDIYVVADARGQINEPNENNNDLSKVIVVYSINDIIVNDTTGDRVISAEEGATVPFLYQHGGFTLVEEHGKLTISFTTFRIFQQKNYQFNIIVRDQGTLEIIDNSVILTSGPLLRIYLYDNAKLYVNSSQIYSQIYEIHALGNSEIHITDSTINSQLIADNKYNPNVRIYAKNSTLNMPFNNFGGTSRAYFWDVYTPSLALSGSARLVVYQWLEAYVRDTAGTGIPGATVRVAYYLNQTEIKGSPKITDSDGLALFDVVTDVFTATTEDKFLVFRVNANYTYTGQINPGVYRGNVTMSFTSYVEDKSDNVERVDISLAGLKPDLYINSDDIEFSRGGQPRTTVGVDEEILIDAIIQNLGNAGSRDVLVYFYHDIDRDDILEANEKIGQDTITTFMDPEGGTAIASITWIPEEDEVGDNEKIWVVVDPMDAILEVDEDNNDNFTVVNVVLPPDLSITSVRFDTARYQNIDNTTEGELITVNVQIYNEDGHYSANFINVSVYDGKRGTGTLIGNVNMGDNILVEGEARFASITWDTTGEVIGAHIIYVYVEDATVIGGYPITDQHLENNMVSRSFYIHRKPDLYPIQIAPSTTDVTILKNDGTQLTANPQIGQTVLVQVTVFNEGQVYIPAVNVSFYIGDPESGGSKVGTTNVSITLPPNEYRNASLEWTFTGAPGTRDIYAWINEGREVIESDYTNNKVYNTYNFELPPINVTITSRIPNKVKIGDQITVEARVVKTGTLEGIPDLPYTITIVNTATQAVQFSDSGQTNAFGYISERKIKVPEAEGTYTLEISVDYAGSLITASDTFRVVEEPEPILPWWMIILIIVSAVVAILVAGVLLGRYGLGKLVECGECGAFIPEGERKCPKCGAVFETDTAKCSECGAWIRVDSKSCPECGAMFAGIEKEKKDYIERMKLQYTEYVDQFREEAKEDLGEAMTDEMFMEWWKASPKYVGFEEWLAREEELRKGKIINCPQCGTINPQSATICFKCGSVFRKEEEEELPEYEEPGLPPEEVPPKVVPTEAPAAPPVVEKKPVGAPPTVVPKKVVQAPPTVVPKKVVKPPEGRPPTVVPKKVVKRPVEEEE